MMMILQLLGALGMFLYGMNLMSNGLQKTAGSKMRGLLTKMTSSPFKGVMTGLGPIHGFPHWHRPPSPESPLRLT